MPERGYGAAAEGHEIPQLRAKLRAKVVLLRLELLNRLRIGSLTMVSRFRKTFRSMR